MMVLITQCEEECEATASQLIASDTFHFCFRRFPIPESDPE